MVPGHSHWLFDHTVNAKQRHLPLGLVQSEFVFLVFFFFKVTEAIIKMKTALAVMWEDKGILWVHFPPHQLGSWSCSETWTLLNFSSPEEWDRNWYFYAFLMIVEKMSNGQDAWITPLFHKTCQVSGEWRNTMLQLPLQWNEAELVIT